MILKKWLEMIFGGKGDQVVQKMQEWSQKKLNDLFDREKAVAFLPDNVDFDGQLDQEGRKQGKAILTWREDNHGKAVLEGFFHQDELVGNIHIKHLDTDGILLWEELLFCKHGILHGYHLSWSQTKQRRTLFRLIINGNSDQSPSWHASSLGSYFFKDPTKSATAFIYPDLNTAIVGNFEDNSVSQAYEAMITSTTMNEFGILQPQFEQTSKQFVKETANQETICQNPLIRDPYESKWVLVQDSRIPDAGQGLFALQDIKKGQLIAFFYGLPLQNMTEGSDYSIKFSDELLIDIPDNCRSTDIYCATLAHKICHSFEANAEYSYAFHPRFGQVVRCAVAVKDIEAQCLKMFQKSLIFKDIIFQ